MRSVRDTIGKSVIAIDTGDKIGTVSDALLDDGDVRLVALVLGGGVLGKEHVVRFEEVQTLGGDTVLVRTGSAVLGAREWREAGIGTTRSSALKGRPVVTATGHRLGDLSDVLVEERTGVFSALEVSASDFGGLRTKRSTVRAVSGVRIGPDAIVVPDSAAQDPAPERETDEPASTAP